MMRLSSSKMSTALTGRRRTSPRRTSRQPSSDWEASLLLDKSVSEVHTVGLNINGYLTGERVFEDLGATYWMICLALIGACILSFIWIILMRFLASIMVWLSVAIVFLGTGSGLGYSGYR